MHPRKHSILAIALFVAVSCASAQAPFVSLMGHNNAEEATCMAILPSGPSVHGGRRYVPNSGFESGYIIWEQAANPGNAAFAKTYTFNSGDFEIRAMDAATPNGTLAVVANRSGAGLGSDGVFMHLSSTGSVLAAKSFNSSNIEILHDVKCLGDGSFLVAGQIQNASTQMSAAFITKIGSASSGYPVQWSRVLGSTSGNVWTFDRAVAVELRSDGSILVAGFTDQGATTPEGDVFLWQLNTSGNTLQQLRYTMPPEVRRPFTTDMSIDVLGNVHIVGNAQDANGKLKGFHLHVAPDLITCKYRHLSLVSDSNRDVELRSVSTNGSAPAIWAAGVVDMSTTGTTNQNMEGLLVQFSNQTGLQRSHLIGFEGADALNAVRVELSTVARTSGLSNFPLVSFLNLQGANVLSGRTSVVGNNCNTRDVSLIALPFNPVVSSMFLPIGTVVTVSPASILVGTPTFTSLGVCTGFKMAQDGSLESEEPTLEEVAYEVNAPLIFPNPARSIATLRMPEQSGAHAAQLFDISGKLVREFLAGSTETEIDLNGLRPGLYILQVQSSQDIHRLKLMVE